MIGDDDDDEDDDNIWMNHNIGMNYHWFHVILSVWFYFKMSFPVVTSYTGIIGNWELYGTYLLTQKVHFLRDWVRD